MVAQTADQAGDSEAAPRALRLEAATRRYGDTESARRSYDQLVTWARGIPAGDRERHRHGAWFANDLLKVAAVSAAGVQLARELGQRHRAEGAAPYGDLADSGSADLMTALGETSATTELNQGYRLALCEAYAAGLAGE